MTNYSPSQEFENEITIAMDVPEATIDFIKSLRGQLQIEKPGKQKVNLKPRLAWILVAIVLAITITITAIGPQKVLAAFERIFGYIPGVGVMEKGEGLLILAEPIGIYREGILVRLEQVVADPNRTVVIYSVENIPLEVINGLPESTITGSSPLLGLPGDRILEVVSGEGRGWGTGYVEKIEFPALPNNVNQILLLIPILEGVPKGAAPEDWMFQIDLIPAPSDYAMLPVYEVATTETPSLDSLDIGDPQNGLIQINSEYGIKVELERVIETEKGFIFEGHVSWDQDSDIDYVYPEMEFSLFDSEGQEIPSGNFLTSGGGSSGTPKTEWVFETRSKNHPSPWTIKLSKVLVDQNVSGVYFNVDLGPDVQIGQIWDQNQIIKAAGKQFELIQVELEQGTGRSEEMTWLNFSFNVDEEITGISLIDLETNYRTGKGEQGDGGTLISGNIYDEIPTGKRNLELHQLKYFLDIDWQFEWQPPNSNDNGSLITEDVQIQNLGDYESQLVLDRVIELDEGLIFEGRLTWQDNPKILTISPASISLLDANFQEIITDYRSGNYSQEGENEVFWSFQTNSKNHPGPYHLVVEQIDIVKIQNTQFSVDLGLNPEVGQKWPLDMNIDLDGKTLLLSSVEVYHEEGKVGPWLQFNFLTEDQISNISMWDSARSDTSGHSTEFPGKDGKLSKAFTYHLIPKGERIYQINNITFGLNGLWQVDWIPPYGVDLESESLEQNPQVCLTDEKWEEIKSQLVAQIPEEITGHLLIETQTGLSLPQLSLLSLSDNTSRTYRIGAWSSLSPDSSKIVVPIDEGLVVVDTKTGNENILQIPTRANYPIWFPDGEEILYLDDINNVLYQINLEGSEIDLLAFSPEIIYPSGFIPGEYKLYYVALSRGGVNYRTINLYNGANEVLISTDNTKPNSRPIVSPNGEWFLFSTRIFGLFQINSMLVRADGSDERILSSVDLHPVSPGAWSLDSKWVIVNVHHMDEGISKVTPVLIQPETCEVVSLGDNLGQVIGWGP